VDRHRACLAPRDCVGDFLRAGAVDVEQRDVRALFRESARGCRADALRRAAAEIDGLVA